MVQSPGIKLLLNYTRSGIFVLFLILSLISGHMVSARDTLPNFFPASDVIPNDPFTAEQHYLSQIQVPGAWEISTGTRDVVVVVLDAGVDIFHPDLLGNIWVNTDEIGGNNQDDDHNGYVDDVNGYDFIEHTPDPRPKAEETSPLPIAGLQHGTVIAGIIGAIGNNHEGVTGINWSVRIMPLRVLNSRGEGTIGGVVEAIDYAIKNGAHIINMSFVGAEHSTLLDAAIERAYRAGIIVVAAGGNAINGVTGADLDFIPSFPVCSLSNQNTNYLLGVAALDRDDELAFFSNYGSQCIDLAAPGVALFSTQTINKPLGLTEPYGNYRWSGTSFAAPQVSGVAALMKATNPTLNNGDIIRLLIETGTNIDAMNFGFVGKVGKKLNALTALERALRAPGSVASRVPRISQKFLPEDPFNTPIFGVLSTTKQGIELYLFNQDSLLLKVIRKDLRTIPSDSHLVIGNVLGDTAQELIFFGGKNDRTVEIFNLQGELLKRFTAYQPKEASQLELALGDIDGDGLQEIITVPASISETKLRIFRGDGTQLQETMVYSQSRVPLHVVVGDMSGDSRNEIVVSAGGRGGPQISIYNNNLELQTRFFVADKRLRTGTLITLLDTSADGVQELITFTPSTISAPKKSSSSQYQLRIWDSHGKEFSTISLAFAPLSLQAGILNTQLQSALVLRQVIKNDFQLTILNPDGTTIQNIRGNQIGIQGKGEMALFY